MNREIKFRGYNTTTKTMVDLQKITPFATELPGLFLPQLPDLVLMQATGLKDKNGKEIYEGDILSSERYPFQGDGGHNYAAEVVFESGGFHAVLALTPGGAARVNGATEGNSTSGDEISQLEVIGNIYENAELLK